MIEWWADPQSPSPKVSGHGEVEARDRRHLATSQGRRRSSVKKQYAQLVPAVALEEDEGIEYFFGQLWAVPHPRKARVRHWKENFLWICHDLWESKNFKVSDCYPIQKGTCCDQIGRRAHLLVISGGKVSSDPSSRLSEVRWLVVVLEVEVGEEEEEEGRKICGVVEEEQVAWMMINGGVPLPGGTRDSFLALSSLHRSSLPLASTLTTLSLHSRWGLGRVSSISKGLSRCIRLHLVTLSSGLGSIRSRDQELTLRGRRWG
jgi:hypothetical protein